jgi:hypothetical protein
MNCGICKSEAIQAKDGLCRGCRLRANVKRIYPFTPEMDAQLTRIYRSAKNKLRHSAAMTDFATHYRMPKYIVQNRAQTLNLRTRIQIPWSAEDIEYISENAGRISIFKMSKHVRRSPGSVKQKLFALGIGAMVVEGFSQRELASNFGVPHSTIARWLGRGWLWLEGDRIPHEAVAKFVWEHMAEYRFAAAEEWWLKVMLNPTLGTAQVRDRRKEAAGSMSNAMRIGSDPL